MDIRQSQQYADYLEKKGWVVKRINNTNYFIRTLPLIGSILKVQRPKKIDFKEIDKLARKYRSFQVIVEPENNEQTPGLIKSGFRLSKSPFLPSKTLQIDLTKSKDYIFSNFKKDVRQAIRKGSGQVIKSYSSPNEIKKFRKGWKNCVNFKRFVPGEAQLINLRKSFPQSKSLFLASHNISSSIIGGAIFTRSSHDIVYYWQAFTSDEGRTSLSQYSLLYQGILWGKKMGCKIFDFEGVYDERFPNKSWLGFTHFKKSFGGHEVSYPGCYIRFRFPI
jgi:lipid II:glycine glycyltransferase (peptidoglycan interpeptide bridge formation enzyme)